MGNRRKLGMVLAASTALWSADRARSSRVSAPEERVFRAVNNLPDRLYLLVWPVMQMGSLAAVFVAATGTRRRVGVDEAVIVAAMGTAVWGGVKLIKPAIGRGRPIAHLADVEVRGRAQTGLGYPSGHAAVSLTLALVATRSSSLRRLAMLGSALTGASRLYVGAHLPLDVIGGAAVGWLVGSAAGSARPFRDDAATPNQSTA